MSSVVIADSVTERGILAKARDGNSSAGRMHGASRGHRQSIQRGLQQRLGSGDLGDEGTIGASLQQRFQVGPAARLCSCRALSLECRVQSRSLQ